MTRTVPPAAVAAAAFLASAVPLVAISLRPDVITRLHLSVGVLLMAFGLVTQQLISHRSGESANGFDYIAAAAVAGAAHLVLANALQPIKPFERDVAYFTLVLCIGFAIVAAVKFLMLFVVHLRTRRLGLIMIALTVPVGAGIMLLSFPGDFGVPGFVRASGFFTIVFGLGGYSVVAALVAQIPQARNELKATGLLHLALLLEALIIAVMHATRWWELAPATAFSILLLIGIASARSQQSNERHLEADAAVPAEPLGIWTLVIALLAPGAAWMFHFGGERPLQRVALTAVTILFSTLMMIFTARRHSARTKNPPDMGVPFADERLRVHFQPMYSRRDGAMVGAEALLRATDAEGNIVSAVEVVRNLGVWPSHDRVTDFVVEQTLLEGTSLLAALSRPDAFVSFNLAPAELMRPDLLDRLRNALDLVGGSADGFAIEITEETTIFEHEGVTERLEALRSLGFLVVLDDFGSGYANLKTLATFDFDLVKVDRSIVLGADSPRGRRTLDHVIDLLRGAGTTVIVEGVEHDPGELFAESAPDIVQGYAFGMPMPMVEVLFDLSEPTGLADSAIGIRPTRHR